MFSKRQLRARLGVCCNVAMQMLMVTTPPWNGELLDLTHKGCRLK